MNDNKHRCGRPGQAGDRWVPGSCPPSGDAVEAQGPGRGPRGIRMGKSGPANMPEHAQRVLGLADRLPDRPG